MESWFEFVDFFVGGIWLWVVVGVDCGVVWKGDWCDFLFEEFVFDCFFGLVLVVYVLVVLFFVVDVGYDGDVFCGLVYCNIDVW